jgi:hypothetical protein
MIGVNMMRAIVVAGLLIAGAWSALAASKGMNPGSAPHRPPPCPSGFFRSGDKCVKSITIIKGQR